MIDRGHVSIAGGGALQILQAKVDVSAGVVSGSEFLTTLGLTGPASLYYVCLNPTSAMAVGFNSATLGNFLFNQMTSGSIVAKDFGDFRFLTLPAGEPLKLRSSVNVGFVYVNVFYTVGPT